MSLSLSRDLIKFLALGSHNCRQVFVSRLLVWRVSLRQTSRLPGPLVRGGGGGGGGGRGGCNSAFPSPVRGAQGGRGPRLVSPRSTLNNTDYYLPSKGGPL